MPDLLTTLIAELERPREVSPQVVNHLLETYDIDRDGIGAFLVTLPFMLFRTGFELPALNPTQIATLFYLGILASGLCFFWWNLGATRVNAGTLAVFNNAKVPLGVACSLLFFGETADLPRLAVGGALLIAAVAVAETKSRPV